MSWTEVSRFDDHNNNNDNEIEVGEYSQDDSFIKMIYNTNNYKEMSLVITPAINENTLTNIKTEIEEEYAAFTSVWFVPPPLGESSPKKV